MFIPKISAGENRQSLHRILRLCSMAGVAACLGCIAPTIYSRHPAESSAEPVLQPVETLNGQSCPVREDARRYKPLMFRDGLSVQGFATESGPAQLSWIQRFTFSRPYHSNLNAIQLSKALRACQLGRASIELLEQWVRIAGTDRDIGEHLRHRISMALEIDLNKALKQRLAARNVLKSLVSQCLSHPTERPVDVQRASKICEQTIAAIDGSQALGQETARQKLRNEVARKLREINLKRDGYQRARKAAELCGRGAGKVEQPLAQMEERAAQINQLLALSDANDHKLKSQCETVRNRLLEHIQRVKKRNHERGGKLKLICKRARKIIAEPMRTLTSIAYADRLGEKLRALSSQVASKARKIVRRNGKPSIAQQAFIACVSHSLSAADDVMRGIYAMNRGRYARDWISRRRFSAPQEALIERIGRPKAQCRGYVRRGLGSDVLRPIDAYLNVIKRLPTLCRP